MTRPRPASMMLFKKQRKSESARASTLDTLGQRRNLGPVLPSSPGRCARSALKTSSCNRPCGVSPGCSGPRSTALIRWIMWPILTEPWAKGFHPVVVNNQADLPQPTDGSDLLWCVTIKRVQTQAIGACIVAQTAVGFQKDRLLAVVVGAQIGERTIGGEFVHVSADPDCPVA